MTVSRRLAGTTLALLFALCVPAGARACSCFNEPIPELVSRLGILFDGTVEGSPKPAEQGNHPEPQETVTFKVGRVWKGEVGPSYSVVFPVPSGANCGTEMKTGQSFVIGATIAPGAAARSSGCLLLNLNQPTMDYVKELGVPREDYSKR